MILTTEVNWETFRYLWSDNPQKRFESLTYLLFCREFDQNIGIFRYRNQPHIETNPICVDEKTIGFQSKYYEPGTRMSEKEDELIRAVEGAARLYPDITTLYFYIHPEFGPSNKKSDIEPKYQKNIETAANKLGIEIVWRGPSNIEAQLMQSSQYNVIRDIFFQADSVVREFCKKLEQHKESILLPIQTSIQFQDNNIVLEMNELNLDDFLASSAQVLLVEGEAGVGKSALVKQALSAVSDAVVLAFRSSDLDVEDKDIFTSKYGSLGLEDVLEVYREEAKKIVFVDAAEKYFVFENAQTADEIFRAFLEAGWKIIFTIRTAYLESFRSGLREAHGISTYCVNPICREKLLELSQTYEFALPHDNSLATLLCIPFYLEMYLNLDSTSSKLLCDLTQNTFERKIWEDIVLESNRRRGNMPVKRESLIINLIMQMLQDETYFYEIKTEDDHEVLSELEKKGILCQTDDARSYYFGHDVFEELVVKHIFSKRYQDRIQGAEFFGGFSPTLRTRKLFQTWVVGFVRTKEPQDMISMILGSDDIEQIWKDEVLITIVRLEELRDNLCFLLSNSMGNSGKDLTRIAFVINACCREADYANFYLDKGILLPFRAATPVGYAWQVMFEYVNGNKEQLDWDGELFAGIIDALDSWTNHSANFKTEATAHAGEIGLFLLEKIAYDKTWTYNVKDDQLEKLQNIILRSAWMIKDKLEILFQIVLNGDTENRVERFVPEGGEKKAPQQYSDLAKCAISDLLHCGNVPCAMPQITVQLMKRLWYKDYDESPFHNANKDSNFGFNEYVSRKYYPANAFITPIIKMLQSAKKMVTDFLLELCNRAGDCYKASHLNVDYKESKVITLFVDGTKVDQIASARLWNMYRDEGCGSYLLASLLMGLERWLLEVAQNTDSDALVKYCRYLLIHSQNVMITAVVVSVAEAYPDKMIDVVCDFIKTKEIFRFDTDRFVSEISFSTLPLWDAIYREERRESHALPHRKVRLEEVVQNYQTIDGCHSEKTREEQLQEVFHAIDAATTDIESWNPADKFPYYRMDSRRYQEVIDVKEDAEGRKVVELGVRFSKDMEEHRELIKNEDDQMWKYSELELWSNYKFNGDEKYKEYSQYENVTKVSDELFEIWQQLQAYRKQGMTKEDMNAFSLRRYRQISLFASSVLLRDFKENLSDDELELCETIVRAIGNAFLCASDYEKAQTHLEAVAIASGLVCLADGEDRESTDKENPFCILIKLIVVTYRYEAQTMRKIASVLWERDEQIGWKSVYLFSLFADRYEQDVIAKRSMSDIEFWSNCNEKLMAEAERGSITFADFNFEEITPKTIFAISLLIPAQKEAAVSFARATIDITQPRAFADKSGAYYSDRDCDEYILDYIWWLAELLLYCEEDDRKLLVEGFVTTANMDKNSNVEYFLEMLIENQKMYGKVEEFWYVWELLEPMMVELCRESPTDARSADVPTGNEAIVATYLFANTVWDKGEDGGALFSEDKAEFFERFINECGNLRVLFFAMAKFLKANNAEPYQKQGITWVAQLVERDPHYEVKFYKNTLYNLEEYVGGFVTSYQHEFKRDAELFQKTQHVLDYLFQQGSHIAFFIREQI